MLEQLPFDIQSIHQAYRQGTTPHELLRECTRRIAAHNDPGIFIYQLDQAAIEQQIAQLGVFDLNTQPLWGIPCAIKDNIDMAGVPTTAACPAFEYTAKQDAEVVKQLKQAGAIIVGKTNLDQFATGLVGVRSPYPPPKNAIDPDIVPGGSSSGSGVSVAAGLVTFSLGTDTAGSGRIPAALNNIVGLKPSLGAISCSGVIPACRSLDTVSVFALTARDAYQVFQTAAVFDEDDAYSRRFVTARLSALPETLKVAVPDLNSRRFFGDDVQAENYAANLKMLESLGAEIIEIDFSPFYETADLLYEGAWVAERYAAIETMITQQPEALFPATRAVISKAEQFNAVDTFRNLYKLQDLKRKTAPLIACADLICTPTMPTFYSVADLEADPIGPNTRLGTYTNFVNLLDLCGFTVPSSPRTDGRPGSLTLLAPAGQDALLAALADTIQRHCAEQSRSTPSQEKTASNLDQSTLGATPWQLPNYPPLNNQLLETLNETKPQETNQEYLELAVVGAHMSGLPLNPQLTELGAEFVRQDSTTPEYQLYRLAGGPPYRPGLVKSSDGAAIALEIWRLPLTHVGAFLRQVPSPLAIGTLTLSSGSSVMGFVCEALATQDAENITHFGGWRSYLATLT